MTRVRLAMDIVSFERCFIWYQVEVLGEKLEIYASRTREVCEQVSGINQFKEHLTRRIITEHFYQSRERKFR